MGAALALAACGTATSAGEVGATPGGVKDLALAKAKVAAGQVPLVDDLPYEGAYAEHDLPVEGAPCTTTLCVRAAGAEVDGASWLHVGLSSGLDLTNFRRPALNAAVVLDNSGSMGVEKMEAVKAAAERLIDLLGPEDTLTVVRFDNFSQVLAGPAAVVDRERFKQAVRGIKAAGSTCIECGLRDAFSQLARVQSAQRANRVFLFTDAQPNAGATGAGEFIDLLEAAAEHEQYLTLFGVGLDFGQALTTRVAAVRGANAFFLATPEQVRAVFDEDFELLVTPVAFDLTLTVLPVAGRALVEVYGAPGQVGSGLSSTVKTVFLSRRRGALVARLEGVGGEAPLAQVSLQYTAAGTSEALSVRAAPPVDQAFDVVSSAAPGEGTRRAVTLTRAMTSLRAACTAWYSGQPSVARGEAGHAVVVLADANDPALAADLAFAKKLTALLRQ